MALRRGRAVLLLFLGSSVEVTATPTGTVNLMPIAFGLAGADLPDASSTKRSETRSPACC